MWILWVLGVMLIGLLSWILLAPMQLEIDTGVQLYEFRWRTIGKVGLTPTPNDLTVYWQLFFFSKEYSLTALVARQQSKPKRKKQLKKKKPKKKRFKRRSWRKWLRKGNAVVNSFKVREFYLNLDTDDYILNSYLVPVFFFLSRNRNGWNINYKGESELRLSVENSPWRIIRAIIF